MFIFYRFYPAWSFSRDHIYPSSSVGWQTENTNIGVLFLFAFLSQNFIQYMAKPWCLTDNFTIQWVKRHVNIFCTMAYFRNWMKSIRKLYFHQECARFAEFFVSSWAPWLMFSYNGSIHHDYSIQNIKNSANRAHPSAGIILKLLCRVRHQASSHCRGTGKVG